MMKIEVRTQCDLRFSRCLLYFWMRKCFPILTAEIVQVMIAVKVKKAEKMFVHLLLLYCVSLYVLFLPNMSKIAFGFTLSL